MGLKFSSLLLSIGGNELAESEGPKFSVCYCRPHLALVTFSTCNLVTLTEMSACKPNEAICRLLAFPGARIFLSPCKKPVS